ncbi:glycosyltransferase [Sphingobacterium sp. UBA2074]|uniref:glycosyltransferase n=1 Tax=Sphingobacterium sp. UBA2074 TaxID=1947487 RepID=UPI00257A6D9D|nr:glycosyltransferase [Sphingobacterium sp. UBA2074]
MKILIDNSNLIVGGGIQVGSSFLNDLRKIDHTNEYLIIQSYNSKSSIDKKLFMSNFAFFDLPKSDLNSIKSRITNVLKLEKDFAPDVTFVTFGPCYYSSRTPKIVGFAIPYLIYSNSPFFKQISILERLKYFLLGTIKKWAFIRNSNALIFESEIARQIFSKKISSKIKTFTVNNTINEIFLDESRWTDINLTNDSFFKILCLTANYKHKNLAIIPSIIDILVSKYHMKEFKFLLTISKNELNFDSKYDSYIVYLGKISIDQVPNLYKKIDISFQSSLLEVFSTTYLEAMYMNKPIVASDMPFSRDICGNAALFCSPTNPEEYADAIYNLKNSTALRNQFIEKGKDNLKRFGNSMDRTKSYLKIINSILKNEV